MPLRCTASVSLRHRAERVGDLGARGRRPLSWPFILGLLDPCNVRGQAPPGHRHLVQLDQDASSVPASAYVPLMADHDPSGCVVHWRENYHPLVCDCGHLCACAARRQLDVPVRWICAGFGKERWIGAQASTERGGVMNVTGPSYFQHVRCARLTETPSTKQTFDGQGH